MYLHYVHMMVATICIQPLLRKIMMTRSLEDVYTYYKQALDLLSTNHPHYEEIKSLLINQVNDELDDYDHNGTI